MLRVAVIGCALGALGACSSSKEALEKQPFEKYGLQFDHPKGWAIVEWPGPPAPRFLRDPSGRPPAPDPVFRVTLARPFDPSSRIEVAVGAKGIPNLGIELEVERRARWGQHYERGDAAVKTIGDVEWLRTTYRYPDGKAIEYATLDRTNRYVVTMFGSSGLLGDLDDMVAASLRRAKPLAMPLVERTSRHSYSTSLTRAFDSAAMVVAADVVDGRLVVTGVGSGVIVGVDGSILTMSDVIRDKERLHDLVVIGKYSGLDRDAELLCVGKPAHAKLQLEHDLALIKCELDFDGKPWKTAVLWRTLPAAPLTELRAGTTLWVAGFSEIGSGEIRVSSGELRHIEDGYYTTDLSINRGTSGAPVVDERGRLVGLASPYRHRITASGEMRQTSQIGRVRSVSVAADLLTIAELGWTPGTNTGVAMEPPATEGPDKGIQIATKVSDAAKATPVADAVVLVLRPEIHIATMDVNALDTQVLAWGRSNARGEVALKQRVPAGTFSVVVFAPGYEPLLGEEQLKLDDKSPAAFDPWGDIKLRAR